MRPLGGERAEGFRRWSWHTSLRRRRPGFFQAIALSRLSRFVLLCPRAARVLYFPSAGATSVFAGADRVSRRPGRNYSTQPNEHGGPAAGPALGLRDAAQAAALPVQGFCFSRFVYALLRLWLSRGGLGDAGCGVSDGGLELVWFAKR